MKPTLLVSACLLGHPVHYDGTAKKLPPAIQHTRQLRYQLVSVCPECLGGLPTPRPPAEIQGGTGQDVLAGRARVCAADGQDVSPAFIAGAQRTLDIARQHGSTQALLKANSPSCGKHQIYDGHFDGTLRPGSGVCTALLQGHGITVHNEDEVDVLLRGD